jgi:hypothetical protein
MMSRLATASSSVVLAMGAWHVLVVHAPRVRISRVEDGRLSAHAMDRASAGRIGGQRSGTRPLTQLAFTTDPASGEFTIDVV